MGVESDNHPWSSVFVVSFPFLIKACINWSLVFKLNGILHPKVKKKNTINSLFKPASKYN